MPHALPFSLALALATLAHAALADGLPLRQLSPPRSLYAAMPSGAPLVAAPILGSPGQQCRAAARAAEQAVGIPRQLLAAIGRIESGRPDGAGGVDPWPWSINAEGIDHVYDTKAAAIAGVLALQAKGVRSIDVGCLQVNLMYHPDAFASLSDGFDPAANAAYGARFLKELFARTGSWPAAVAAYHSATPELGAAYERKVAAIWPEEQRRVDNGGSAQASWAPLTPMQGAGTPAAAAASNGAIMLGNRAETARIIPLTGSGLSRGLDAYRAMPIPVASRLCMRAPS